ncbi:MAG: hypothetical protein ACODAG_00965 [Myxococcota bacterium]
MAAVLWALGCGCASQSAGRTPATVPAVVANPSDERLQALRSVSRELANHVVQLHERAREYARLGQTESARELALLARLTTSMALEWQARQEVVDAAGREAPAPAPESEADTVPDTPSEQDGASSTDAVASGRGASGDESAPDHAGPQNPASQNADEDGASTPDTPTRKVARTQEVADRLATLASGLVEIEPGDVPERRVQIDRAQSLLIRGHRALGRGQVQEAEKLADEVRQTLIALGADIDTGSGDTAAEAIVREARRQLGSGVAGSDERLGVRLEPLVHFRDGSWATLQAETLQRVGDLARQFPAVSFSLVTHGKPESEAFERERKGLRRHLRRELGLSDERLRPGGSGSGSWEQGTYLVFELEEEE